MDIKKTIVVVSLGAIPLVGAYAQYGAQTSPGQQGSQQQSGQQMDQTTGGTAAQQGQATGGGPMAGAEMIREVQQALNDKGYKAGRVDGIWGPKTENALKQYQQAEGLQPTGQPDEQTLSSLGVESSIGAFESGPQSEDTEMQQQQSEPTQQPQGGQQMPDSGPQQQ